MKVRNDYPASFRVGIEGPAGSGKSTMATTVGRELDAPVIEGGRIYRTLTFVALIHKIQPDDLERLLEITSNIRYVADNGSMRVFHRDADLTDELDIDEINANVASFAANLEIRPIVDAIIDKPRKELERSISVGRVLYPSLKAHQVLRITLSGDTLEQRNLGNKTAVTHVARNQRDSDTYNRLVISKDIVEPHIATVDVSAMSEGTQADVLRQFIKNQPE